MSGPVSVLGTPVDLGRVRLRNRIVLLPHGLFFATWDRLVPSARHVDYYRSRAAGGAALVCTESSVVSADGQQGAPLVLSSDPACVDGYRRIAKAVHEEGSLLSVQLTHYGNQASQSVTRSPLIGPSQLPDPALREPARAMNSDDMARVVGDFVTAARNLVAAGVDVVDLKVAHDGLLRQFLSPLCNDRADEYGGSRDRRIGYPLQVLAAVRQAVGDAVGVSVRLVLDEGLPGGYGLDDGMAFASAFGESGLVDFIVADLGVWASMPMVVAPMSVPEGYAIPAVRAAAGACAVPVVGFGAIRSAAMAEQLVADGTVAAVGMARQHLAEPEFTRKVLSGQAARIRPCTACNQQCVGNSMKSLPVSCTVNPLVGAGEVRQPRHLDRVGQRVVVVGAGPAGMEAARLLAEDGHRVTLFERNEVLGGQLALAARTGGRTGWQPYLDWLTCELGHTAVDVHLTTTADSLTVTECDPDMVVFASGSEPGSPPVEGMVTLDEYLAGDVIGGGRVVLADFGVAGPALWSAAIEAWDRGASSVAIVTPLPVVGGDLDGATFLGIYPELVQRGTMMYTDHRAVSFERNLLVVTNVYGGTESVVPADVVVASVSRRPAETALQQAVTAAMSERRVTLIGDAVVPRDVAAAVRDAYQFVAGFAC